MKKLNSILYTLLLATLMLACGEDDVAPEPVLAVVSGPYGFKLEMVSDNGDKKTLSGDWADLMGINQRLNRCRSKVIRLYDEQDKSTVRILFTLPKEFDIADEQYNVNFVPLEETAYLDYPTCEFIIDGTIDTDWSTLGSIKAVVSNPDYALLGEVIDVVVKDENNQRWTVNGNFWLKELKNKSNQ